MSALLSHLGVLTAAELARPGCSWPWKLAASALASGRKLSWPELWDVLRWYAHNRGYDGNLLWKRGEENSAEAEEDRESLMNAHALMREHGKPTMCETFCAVLMVDPNSEKASSHVYFKGKKASFPRETIEAEVTRLLANHIGTLPKLDKSLIRALTGNPVKDPEAWQAVPCPTIRLPKRYWGGLLFGQLAPRFDNRIIGTCTVSGEKLPTKACSEFLEYRWAMILSNVRVYTEKGEPRALSASERRGLTLAMRRDGYFTKTTLKKALKSETGTDGSNLETMLMHPDAEEALVLYPALKAITTPRLAPFWAIMDERQKRDVLKKIQRQKIVTLGILKELLHADQIAPFNSALAQLLDSIRIHANKNKDPESSRETTEKPIRADYPTGRAPFSRGIMRKAVEEVMAGKDPRQEGGCLFHASREGDRIAENEIHQRTNNHLVRHRLLILRRLANDIINEYANGDLALIAGITIEVNRDVKDMSGKTAKTIAQEMGLRLAQHKKVTAEMKKALGLGEDRLGGSFIRKARIADDLNWTCPYTGQQYDLQDIRSRRVDLDHVIPRSARASDSLDSLVITFKEVNAWKGARTALQFIKDEQGKPVPGLPNLSLLSEARYRDFVEKKLSLRGSHPDDERRRRNRKKRLLTLTSNEPEFTPGDLTVTSHLVTLASAVTRDLFSTVENPPRIFAIPGKVTKEVRTTWNLIGLLAPVNPLVLNPDGTLKTKTEIREISHLHHAVDACVLGLASSLIPANGTIWGLMAKRHHSPTEAGELVATGAFQRDASGRVSLCDLPDATRTSMANALAERRVVMHVPRRKRGVSLKQNVWRLTNVEEGVATIRQRHRDEKTGRLNLVTAPKKQAGKLLGVAPDGHSSKLKAIKGVIEINENFGVALVEPEPQVIPFHKVWQRIGALRKKNGGVLPVIIRNGQIIEVTAGNYAGIWRVCSVKNNTGSGASLDIAKPDFLKPTKEIPGFCCNGVNVLIKSLLRAGLVIHDETLTGVASCHTTSSTSAARHARSHAETAN